MGKGIEAKGFSDHPHPYTWDLWMENSGLAPV